MNKKILLLVFIVLIVLSGSIFIFLRSGKEKPTENNKIILFYGDGCPHCVKVENYLKENNIESKIEFEKKEVYHNKDNANSLTQKAKECGIKENEVGVPFLWTSSGCKIGDEDIINFFKEKVRTQ